MTGCFTFGSCRDPKESGSLLRCGKIDNIAQSAFIAAGHAFDNLIPENHFRTVSAVQVECLYTADAIHEFSKFFLGKTCLPVSAFRFDNNQDIAQRSGLSDSGAGFTPAGIISVILVQFQDFPVLDQCGTEGKGIHQDSSFFFQLVGKLLDTF